MSVARAQHVALASVGVFWGSFAALVPDIKTGIGAADAAFGLSLMMAAVGLLLAILMYENRNWRDAEPAPDESDGRTPWVPILLVAAVLMASFISENATETWSALHIERTLGGPPGEGGFGPAAFGLMMGIGRLLGQVAAHRLGEVRLVFWSAVAGIAGAVILMLAPTPTFGVIGVGLLGLGVAVVVPSANSILGRLVRPDQRGLAISRAWMIGFSAFFVGPAMMGSIAEVAGLRVAFGALALIMATILPCVLALRRRGG